MELETHLEKIYIIKSLTVPQGFNIQYHYSKWVSPRPSELRFDRFIDIPFANITFVDAYAKGDFQNGERFMDIGAVGFPSLLRVPFSALSANEFRFPSKNIDQNIRHVVQEMLKNVRFLAMGEEMFRFLSGRQITCLENSSLVQAHVASLFAVVRDKVPLKCAGCKKFLWIELAKVPENPVQAKCPACSVQFPIQRPAGLDMQLSRFLSGAAANAARKGDLLLGSTGEFRNKDFPAMASPGPNLELDLGSILGPATAAPAAPPGSAPAEPSAGVEPGMEEAYQPPPTTEDHPAVELDDDFFQEILPDKEAAVPKEAAPAAVPANLAPSSGFDPSLVISDTARGDLSVKRCHVCQTPLTGGEKVCPSCFSEVMPDEMSLDDMSVPADSQVEIRLKDEVDEGPMPAWEPTPEPTPAEAAAAKQKETPTVWDEPVWSVKVGEETYEHLDMKTVEEWIMSQNIIETDLVRKGEAKWVEIGTVPYFRTTFKQVKEHVRMGGAHALSSFLPAPTPRRLVAGVIDLALCAGFALLGRFIVNITSGGEGGSGLAATLAMIAVPLVYLSFGNCVMGRTIGKGALRLAVVNESGRPIGLGKGFLRAVIAFATVGLGFLASLSDSKHQSVHDKVAGSYVIQIE